MPGGTHPPLSVIAQWPPPNYDGPITRSGLLPVIVVFTVLSVCIVTARLVVRGVIQRNMGIDDWIIMVAMFPTIGLAVGVCIMAIPYHYDRHIWDVPPTLYVEQRKIVFATEILYLLAASLVKISILFFYQRLSPAALTRTYLWIVWGSIVSVALYGFCYTFALIFACSPIDAFWNQLNLEWIATDRHYSCISESSSVLTAAIFSVLQDLIAAILPSWLFWSLKIPMRQKIALAIVFIVGFCTCAIGALRIYYIYQVFYNSYDLTWNAYPLWLLTSLEVLVGTMCASAPPLKVFFRRLLQVRTGSNFFSSEAEPGTIEMQDSISRSYRRSFPFTKRFSRQAHAKLSAGHDLEGEDEHEHELSRADPKTTVTGSNDFLPYIDKESQRVFTVEAHSEKPENTYHEFQSSRPSVIKNDSSKVYSIVGV